MTVIRPNSISGVTSITAHQNSIQFYKSDGTLSGANIDGISINTAGIITANKFYGDGSQLTGISAGTSLSGSTNNTVCTVTGANAITGEANLTFDGTSVFELQPSSATPARFIGDSNRTGAGQHLAHFEGNWNGTLVGRVVVVAGDDTTNKDDGHLDFFTTPSGGAHTRRLRISSSGNVYIGQTSGSEQLGVDGGSNAQTFSTNSTNSNGNMLQVKCSGTTKLFLGSAGSFVTGNTGTTNQGIRAEGSLLFATGGHTERYRISGSGGHRLKCNETYFAGNLSECNSTQLALNINQTRSGVTKGIALGAIGSSGDHTAIQCYDTSNNSANTLMINPFGGNALIGTTSWSYQKPLNVQGSSGAILALSNYDTTSYAADTNTSIEFRINTGNTGNQNGACEIRAFKENGTNGNNARGLNFWTAGNGGSPAERLRISSAGYVTTPYQPMFLGTGAGSQSNSSWYYIVPTAVEFDTASSYISSGTFQGGYEAPVDGKYMCIMNGLVYVLGENAFAQSRFTRNGSQYADVIQFNGNSGNHTNHNHTVLMDCSAGDKINQQLWTNSGGAYGGQWHFIVYLVG
mgnify:CR=1 FL=1